MYKQTPIINDPPSDSCSSVMHAHIRNRFGSNRSSKAQVNIHRSSLPLLSIVDRIRDGHNQSDDRCFDREGG